MNGAGGFGGVLACSAQEPVYLGNPVDVQAVMHCCLDQ